MNRSTTSERPVAKRQTPNMWMLLLAVVSITLGLYLIIRPVLSLGVLALLIGSGAILESVITIIRAYSRNGILEGRDNKTPRILLWLEALAWLALGIFVLVFPGLTVRLLTAVVAVVLAISGGRHLFQLFAKNSTPDARISSALLGIATIAIAVVAFTWPDITSLVIAVVFGARLIITGISSLWNIFSKRNSQERTSSDTQETTAQRPSAFKRFTRTLTSAVAAIAAILLLVVSINVNKSSSVTDEFYAPPRVVPSEAGELIRYEPFTRKIPSNANAWRILYTTTHGDGSAAVASGIVVVPKEGSEHPVIDWAHGTTGYDETCAPTLLSEPFESGALFVVPEIIDNGWALVATDYIGLGTTGPHPYLIGIDSGNAVLDATKAATQIPEASLANQVAIWGHSQGGGAALWAAALSPEYAPELNIAGVAALAPAANIPGLIGSITEVTGGSIFGSYVVSGYTATYPDVTWREYIRPGAEPTVHSMADRCLSSPSLFVSVLALLGLSADPNIFLTDPATGPFMERAKENVPPATINIPVFLGQGLADDLVTPKAQRDFVDAQTASGVNIDYREYTGLGHVELVEAESPAISELFEWTQLLFSE